MAHKLLVADDDRDIVESLKDRLLREGYEVETAFDGEEALLKVAQTDPDVILLDLSMPKLNGFQVLQEIRQKYTDRWRPIIIVSAQTELETFKKCYSAEADHYITKPSQISDVLRGIQTMISLIPLRIH